MISWVYNFCIPAKTILQDDKDSLQITITPNNKDHTSSIINTGAVVGEQQ